jgi:hypothetical protein
MLIYLFFKYIATIKFFVIKFEDRIFQLINQTSNNKNILLKILSFFIRQKMNELLCLLNNN